jgi:hypothetical protein
VWKFRRKARISPPLYIELLQLFAKNSAGKKTFPLFQTFDAHHRGVKITKVVNYKFGFMMKKLGSYDYEN